LEITASTAKRLTRRPRMREVWNSNPGSAKSYTALQTICHCFNIYASNCVAWRYDTETDTAKSLHASA